MLLFQASNLSYAMFFNQNHYVILKNMTDVLEDIFLKYSIFFIFIYLFVYFLIFFILKYLTL